MPLSPSHRWWCRRRRFFSGFSRFFSSFIDVAARVFRLSLAERDELFVWYWINEFFSLYTISSLFISPRHDEDIHGTVKSASVWENLISSSSSSCWKAEDEGKRTKKIVNFPLSRPCVWLFEMTFWKNVFLLLSLLIFTRLWGGRDKTIRVVCVSRGVRSLSLQAVAARELLL